MDPTPLDKMTDIRFSGDWDLVMKALMNEMKIDVPDYIQQNTVKIARKGEYVEILPKELNHSEIKQVEFYSMNEKSEISTEAEPYRFLVTPQTEKIHLKVYFNDESKKTLEIDFELADLETKSSSIVASYNWTQQEWTDVKFEDE